MSQSDQAARAQTGVPRWVLAAYCLVVAYGTLFPMVDWRLPDDLQWRSLLLAWPSRIPRIDLLTNLLIYVPFGVLWVWRRPRSRAGQSLLIVTLVGAGLSYGLECLQILLPRVPSRLDVLSNALGSLAGGLLAMTTGEGSAIGSRLRALRSSWFVEGHVADVGLLAVALWALSQSAPFVPSADLGNLKNGIRPLWNSLGDPSNIDVLQALGYALSILGLGLLTATATRTRALAAGLFTVVVPVVLIAKVPIITRQLSLEAIAGSGLAILVLPLALRWAPRRVGALVLLASGVLVEGLRQGSGLAQEVAYRPMSWVPLAKHNLNLFDLVDLLGGVWPFLALAYLSRLLIGNRQTAVVAVTGGFAVLATSLGIEWAQQYSPGRTPDSTDVLMATLAWSGAWLLMARASSPATGPT